MFLAAAHAWVLRSDAPGDRRGALHVRATHRHRQRQQPPRAAAVLRVLVHGADPPVRAQSTLLPVGFISSHKLG